MFIKIIYRDSPELSTTKLSLEDVSEEKTLLVNPKCPVKIMLEYIRSRCRLGVFTWFDLCSESGALIGLYDMPPYVYATEHFENGGTYYVMVLNKEKKQLQLFPQLNRNNPLYGELRERARIHLEGGHSATSVASRK